MQSSNTTRTSNMIGRILQLVIGVQIWNTSVVAQLGMGFGEFNPGSLNRYFGQNSLLARAVRDIVHPRATVTQGMIKVAISQRGPPSNREMMMEYMPHLVLSAYQHRVKLNGTSGVPSLPVMQQYILERGINWIKRMGFIAPRTTPRTPTTNEPSTSTGKPNQQTTSTNSVSTESPQPTGSGAAFGNTRQIATPRQLLPRRPMITRVPFLYEQRTNSFFNNNFMMMQLFENNDFFEF